MIEVINPGGWHSLRQIISVSVSRAVPVRIKGGAEAAASPALCGFFDETAKAAKALLGAELAVSDNDVIVAPRPGGSRGSGFGAACVECAAGIPLSDIILFLAPSLFESEFRSVLNLSGTTHAGGSLPISFTRETMFDAAACFGFFAGINLERFGFGAGGSGKLECRVYPAEPVQFDSWQHFEFRRISRARVYFSELEPRAARAQKEYMTAAAGLDPASVSILEIMNSPGRHNSVYIHVETERYDIIFFREISLFNNGDDIQKSAAASLSIIDELVFEAKAFVKSGIIPDFLERELLYYALVSGSVSSPVHQKNRALADALRLIVSALV